MNPYSLEFLEQYMTIIKVHHNSTHKSISKKQSCLDSVLSHSETETQVLISAQY